MTPRYRPCPPPHRALTHSPGRIAKPRAALSLVAALLIVPACSRAPVLSITNHSSHTLSNVVVSGSGFNEPIPPLAPGGQHTQRVHPRGESGVRLVFDAGPHHADSGDQGYFEPGGGYRIQITVDTNLAISVSPALTRP